MTRNQKWYKKVTLVGALITAAGIIIGAIIGGLITKSSLSEPKWYQITVLEKGSRAPIERATVTITLKNGKKGGEGITDKKGGFKFEVCKDFPQNFTVSIDKENYERVVDTINVDFIHQAIIYLSKIERESTPTPIGPSNDEG